MRILPVLLVLGLLGSEARAELKVEVAHGRMSIAATRANVVEILERVSKETGMKVIYDGPRPQKAITKSVKDRTPADAVLAILEGEGINFAVILNPSGTQIETLLVTGPSKAKVAPATPQPQFTPGPDWAVDTDIPPPPPPPAPLNGDGVDEGTPPPPPPDEAAPGNTTNNPTPTPPTLPTPTPQPSSSFTPQGPGPILLPPPAGTPPPTNR